MSEDKKLNVERLLSNGYFQMGMASLAALSVTAVVAFSPKDSETKTKTYQDGICDTILLTQHKEITEALNRAGSLTGQEPRLRLKIAVQNAFLPEMKGVECTYAQEDVDRVLVFGRD